MGNRRYRKDFILHGGEGNCLITKGTRILQSADVSQGAKGDCAHRISLFLRPRQFIVDEGEVNYCGDTFRLCQRWLERYILNFM